MNSEELTFDYAQKNQPWVLEYAKRHLYEVQEFLSKGRSEK
jgi:hypothetical protein